jgi:hypothetical protein
MKAPTTNTETVSVSSTSTTIRTYKALLNQSGTTAPRGSVMYNTFRSAPTWSYIRTGIYDCTFSGVFQTGLLWTQPPIVATGIYPTGGTTWTGNLFFTRLNNNVIELHSPLGNGVLTNTSVEITVYPPPTFTAKVISVGFEA